MTLERVLSNAVLCGLVDIKTDASIPDVEVRGDLASLMQFAQMMIEDHELDKILEQTIRENLSE